MLPSELNWISTGLLCGRPSCKMAAWPTPGSLNNFRESAALLWHPQMFICSTLLRKGCWTTGHVQKTYSVGHWRTHPLFIKNKSGLTLPACGWPCWISWKGFWVNETTPYVKPEFSAGSMTAFTQCTSTQKIHRLPPHLGQGRCVYDLMTHMNGINTWLAVQFLYYVHPIYTSISTVKELLELSDGHIWVFCT